MFCPPLQAWYRAALLLAMAIMLPACSTIITGASQGFTNNLANAILDSDDLELVRDGAPAYLLLIDGLLAGSPDDAGLLSTAARLNSAYAGAFVEEGERARHMHDKALNMARRAVCEDIKDGCDLERRPFKQSSSYELTLMGK